MFKSGKRKKFNHPVTGKNWTLVVEFLINKNAHWYNL